MNSYLEKDILCGRGGKVNRHSGNKVYRRLIEEKKGLYKSLLRTDQKSLLVNSILMALKHEGVRFLKFDEAASKWLEIDDDEAFIKTSQAFREPEKKAAASAEAIASPSRTGAGSGSLNCRTPLNNDNNQAMHCQSSRMTPAIDDDAIDDGSLVKWVPEEEDLENMFEPKRSTLSPPPPTASAFAPSHAPSFATAHGGYSPVAPPLFPPVSRLRGPSPAPGQKNTSSFSALVPTPIHSSTSSSSNAVNRHAPSRKLAPHSRVPSSQQPQDTCYRPAPTGGRSHQPLPRVGTTDISQFMRKIAPEQDADASDFMTLPKPTPATMMLEKQQSGQELLAFLQSISFGGPDNKSLSLEKMCASIGDATLLDPSISFSFDPNSSVDGIFRSEQDKQYFVSLMRQISGGIGRSETFSQHPPYHCHDYHHQQSQKSDCTPISFEDMLRQDSVDLWQQCLKSFASTGTPFTDVTSA